MAVLVDADRTAVYSEFVQTLSALLEEITITKAEMRAAVDATDQWIDDNASSFNAALPLPARNEMTASQKARLFMAVAAKRFDVA